MNSEIINQQNRFNEHSGWLAQVDNVNDIETAQVNGGGAFIEKIVPFIFVVPDVSGLVALSQIRNKP